MQVIYLVRDIDGLCDDSNRIHPYIRVKDVSVETVVCATPFEVVRFVEMSSEDIIEFGKLKDGTYTAQHAENVDRAYRNGIQDGRYEMTAIATVDLLQAAKQLRATVDPITAIQEVCKINPQMIELIAKALVNWLQLPDHTTNVDIAYIAWLVEDCLSRAITPAKMTDIPKFGDSQFNNE